MRCIHCIYKLIKYFKYHLIKIKLTQMLSGKYQRNVFYDVNMYMRIEKKNKCLNQKHHETYYKQSNVPMIYSILEFILVK